MFELDDDFKRVSMLHYLRVSHTCYVYTVYTLVKVANIPIMSFPSIFHCRLFWFVEPFAINEEPFVFLSQDLEDS